MVKADCKQAGDVKSNAFGLLGQDLQQLKSCNRDRSSNFGNKLFNQANPVNPLNPVNPEPLAKCLRNERTD